jgi:hypothetical protein
MTLTRIALVVLLSGCATGAPWLSPLGREANVTPLRGQPVEQIRQDDGSANDGRERPKARMSRSLRPISAMRLVP